MLHRHPFPGLVLALFVLALGGCGGEEQPAASPIPSTGRLKAGGQTPSAAAGPWIDLMPLAMISDADYDVGWLLRDSALKCRGGSGGQIAFAATSIGEYEWAIRFSGRTVRTDVTFSMPVGQHHSSVRLTIGERGCRIGRANRLGEQVLVTAGVEHELIIRLRPGEDHAQITTSFDGQPWVNMRLELADLQREYRINSSGSNRRTLDLRLFKVEVRASEFDVLAVRVRSYDGEIIDPESSLPITASVPAQRAAQAEPIDRAAAYVDPRPLLPQLDMSAIDTQLSAHFRVSRGLGAVRRQRAFLRST